MRHIVAIITILSCLYLGASAFSCYKCVKGCTELKPHKCRRVYDRCIDVAFYSRLYWPRDSSRWSFFRKTMRIKKVCGDAKREKRLCGIATKQRHGGFCNTCKKDNCNNQTKLEIGNELERHMKEIADSKGPYIPKFSHVKA